MQVNISVDQEHDQITMIAKAGTKEFAAHIKRLPDGSVDSDTILSGIRHIEQMVSRVIVD